LLSGRVIEHIYIHQVPYLVCGLHSLICLADWLFHLPSQLEALSPRGAVGVRIAITFVFFLGIYFVPIMNTAEVWNEDGSEVEAESDGVDCGGYDGCGAHIKTYREICPQASYGTANGTSTHGCISTRDSFFDI
jgi:hypothetical protein